MKILHFKRPPGEDFHESCRVIYRELKAQGRRPSKTRTLWLKDEDGMTIYEVEVRE